jgi:predicted nucleotide-binding protein
VAELDAVRAKLQNKLQVGTRRLNQLILQKEGETLLPRRLAILALATENRIPIGRLASEDDLSQLRAVGRPGSVVATRDEREGGLSAGSAMPIQRSRTRPTGKQSAGSVRPKAPTRGRKVFVVHGRNDAVARAMFSFLRSIDLDPLEWNKAIAASKKGTPTMPEIIDAALQQAVAIIVLLTPDDRVTLAKPYRKPSDPPYESRVVGQARPNVLFEAGMAFGRNQNATVIVQVGDVKPFSDVGGRHVTRLTNGAESRGELITKLRNAGCAVDASGTHWMTEGDFEIKENIDGTR